MKRNILKILSFVIAGCLFFSNTQQYIKSLGENKLSSEYERINEKQAFVFQTGYRLNGDNPDFGNPYYGDFTINEVTVDDYAYIAIDFEGNNNPDTGLEISLNNMPYLSPNVSGYSPTISEWTPVVMYGSWFFIPNGRGYVYIPLADCGGLSSISQIRITGSDNRNQTFIFHDVFLCKSLMETSGKKLMDVNSFTFSNGVIDDSNFIGTGDFNVSTINSCEGFDSQRSLTGGLVINQLKNDFVITLPEAVAVNGGYALYDISYNGNWCYYHISFETETGDVFSGSYDFGKTLGKHNQIIQNQVISEFGYTKINDWNVTGTVLDPIPYAHDNIKKIHIYVDNFADGSQMVISNIAYVSNDYKNVTLLLDFASMSDDDFFSICPTATKRAPKQMSIYYLSSQDLENVKASVDGYEFDITHVTRNNQNITLTLNNVVYYLYETTIDYIAYVPWGEINLNNTIVHNNKMEQNEVVIENETAFSTIYSYEKIEAALSFLDDTIFATSFDENQASCLRNLKQAFNQLEDTVQNYVLATGIYNNSLFDLSTKATITLSGDEFQETGSSIEPGVIVEVGNEVLTNGEDYTVNYTNNINPGTAKVTISFIGVFEGTIEKAFTITEKHGGDNPSSESSSSESSLSTSDSSNQNGQTSDSNEENSKGCKGSIAACGTILFFVSISGLVLALSKKEY